MKYLVIMLSFFVLLGACKKDKPVEAIKICDTQKCEYTAVLINGNSVQFAYYEEVTKIDSQGLLRFSLLNQETGLSGIGESVDVVFVPTKIGRYTLDESFFASPRASYTVLSIDNGYLEETSLIETYDNWIEITEVCGDCYTGRTSFQLLIRNGKKSMFYDKADTLNFEFDFKVCL